jgi:hypothetical protein
MGELAGQITVSAKEAGYDVPERGRNVARARSKP